MSDETASGTEHAAGADADQAPLFNREELAGFDTDDRAAGRAIGMMLAVFFLYTVIATGYVAYWTLRSLSQ